MTTEKKTKRNAMKTGIHAFVLLDRTGSMSSRWNEAITSVNAYVEELKKRATNCLVTLACFDGHNGTQFNILRNAMPISQWKTLAKDEVDPRGDTPLLDSVMRLITLSRESKAKRVALVVMTDGEENASTEVKKEDVQKALAQATKKGWQTVFLGVDFDAFGDRRGVGGTGIPSNYVAGTTVASFADATSGIAANTAIYFLTGSQTTSHIRKYGKK